MWVYGEPTLKIFLDEAGKRIKDRVYSIHSWWRSGRSRVSRCAWHNEPKPEGGRQASPQEVYEHGRWEATKTNRTEDMPARYNQWEVVDRLALTLCCM
jgi:hypothetical protein